VTKILVLDIETAPLESYTWGIWEQNVGLEQIKTEWSILSYAGKWVDNKEVFFNHTGGRGAKKVRDDKPLMQELWNMLHAADLVVAQNGAAFDIKKINSRLIIHGFGPYSPIRIIDTLKVAKKHFGFTSNKLAWMSKHLTPAKKSEHKKFPGFELWLECLKDNPAAWTEMRKYNIQDVIATEQLYLKQRPWISNHPNMGAYKPSHENACPKCGSHNVQKRGEDVTQQGRYQRIQCRDCGGWARAKQTEISPTNRKALLVPR
jgi:RNase_H superfamily